MGILVPFLLSQGMPQQNVINMLQTMLLRSLMMVKVGRAKLFPAAEVKHCLEARRNFCPLILKRTSEDLPRSHHPPDITSTNATPQLKIKTSSQREMIRSIMIKNIENRPRREEV